MFNQKSLSHALPLTVPSAAAQARLDLGCAISVTAHELVCTHSWAKRNHTYGVFISLSEFHN